MRLPVLISCGGLARRMGDSARDIPKALLSVAGVPILERLLNALPQSVCGPVVLVVEHLSEMVISHFTDHPIRSKLDIRFVDSTHVSGSTHLLAATPMWKPPFLAIAGNVLVPPETIQAAAVAAIEAPKTPGVVSSQIHRAASHLSCVPDAANRFLIEIVRGRARTPGDWELVDIYVLSEAVIRYMESQSVSHCRAIEQMCNSGHSVGHISCLSEWAHFEMPGDLVSECNIRVAHSLESNCQ